MQAGGNVNATLGTGVILYNGSVDAGRNVEARITGNGTIVYLQPVKAGCDVIANAAAGDILYGGAVNAGRSVIAKTGSGSITYMDKVTAGKDLPEQIRAGHEKVAYYDRYGLIGYGKVGGPAPVRNAKPSEIRIENVQR